MLDFRLFLDNYRYLVIWCAFHSVEKTFYGVEHFNLLALMWYDSFLRDGGLGSAEPEGVQRTEALSSDCIPSITQFQLFK